MQPIYFGIVGQIASGKGEAVKIFTEQYGFVSFNLSSILHAILENKGVHEFTRKDLQDLGDQLRKREGNGVLAKKAVKKLNNFQFSRSNVQRKNINIIIEGIRNPAEVDYLRTLPNFTLIALKARKKIRYQRLIKRKKPWDPKTWDEFIVIDRRDKGLHEKKHGQQVAECVKMADIVLQNNGSVLSLKREIEKLMEF